MRTRRRRPSARSLPRRSTRPPGRPLPGTTTGPWQDPCWGPGKALAKDSYRAAARPASAKAPPPSPCSCQFNQLSKHLRGDERPPRPTQQAPAWWHAGLREGSTIAPAQQPANVAPRRLVSSDACRRQARWRQLGRASLPSPIKREGHVGNALNAFVRRCQTIDSSTVDISTSCVPLWQPLLPIKGGPRRPREGFGSFGQVTPRS